MEHGAPTRCSRPESVLWAVVHCRQSPALKTPMVDRTSRPHIVIPGAHRMRLVPYGLMSLVRVWAQSYYEVMADRDERKQDTDRFVPDKQMFRWKDDGGAFLIDPENEPDAESTPTSETDTPSKLKAEGSD